ncbi:MAG: hypothetical protein H7Y27_12790, partial [Gemmatimonadaceae bacterium]|nr:hypothetical protein [Chitinophagaceae bacterium]
IEKKTKREDDYLNAIGAFYTDHKTTDHATRCNNFVKAMEKLYTDYPDDPEAGIFYALALNGAANPADKTFEKQKKAGVILDKLVAATPEHPGIIHYIIHSYDYPELATLALPAARKYASIAPSSAHAQHMPSHIFTRLGLWEEEIKSNIQSTESAKCYAESTGIKSHWDEELHGLDYLVYGYLQKGDNVHAKQQYDYLKTIKEVYPESFKVAYAYAAIPVRYMLENRLWKEASQLTPHTESFSWRPFPWQKSIRHFGRAMGAVNTGDLSAAKSELKTMNILRDTLVNQKDVYKANQVLVQIKTVDAWINFKEGKTDAALKLMNEAAALEDNTQKHPVTPGEVLPARELLGDMLLQMKKPAEALTAYEASLKTHPNRFNGLFGAGMAAELSGNSEKAKTHFQQLVSISGGSERIEVRKAKSFLSKYNSL